MEVCQNIKKFIAGSDGCKSSDDVAKCESCLVTVNEAFNSAADLLLFIDSKRKGLFHEDHTPKTFASDELKVVLYLKFLFFAKQLFGTVLVSR